MNKIPIKGYATFHPLKHCLIGKHFSSDFFKKNIKNVKVADPLRRIADETEEDFLKLETILKSHNIKTYRPIWNENDFDSSFKGRPPVCPRDHFAVIGETFYATHPTHFYGNLIKQIDKNNLFLQNWDYPRCLTSTAFVVRIGKIFFGTLIMKIIEIKILEKKNKLKLYKH